MSRLIVFGCSHTYGHGLDDCYHDTSKPSKLVWGSVIAKQLNRQLINKSFPGASNKYIWDQIINTQFETGDLVIILWSYMSRNTILLGKNKVVHLSHAHLDTDEKSAAYFKHLHSNYDSRRMTELYIRDATNYLETTGAEFYQLIANKYEDSLFGGIAHLDLYIDDYRVDYPKAMDGNHMGVSGNIKFASDILTRIGHTSTLPQVELLPLKTRIKNWFLVRMGVGF
jgi:hypothetical protein